MKLSKLIILRFISLLTLGTVLGILVVNMDIICMSLLLPIIGICELLISGDEPATRESEWTE